MSKKYMYFLSLCYLSRAVLSPSSEFIIQSNRVTYIVNEAQIGSNLLGLLSFYAFFALST